MVAVAALLLTTVVAVTGPAAAGPPSVSVSGVFSKAAYYSGDAVSVTLSVHNTGTAAVSGVWAMQDIGANQLSVDSHGFGVLEDGGPGATIAAGHTASVTITGHAGSPTANTVALSGNLFDRQGNEVSAFSLSTEQVLRTATWQGTVFADRNANGRADKGEPLSGVTLHMGWAYGSASYAVTTGAGGRFSRTLPTGSYYYDGSGHGWYVIPKVLVLTARSTAVSLRAVRPLGHVLTASIRFAKKSYAPHATVHLVVTVKNTGSTLLRGIGAECDHVGDPDELSNRSKGWGALDVAVNPGALTIPAHRSVSVPVVASMPAAAQSLGQVVAECDFGYPVIYAGYRAQAFATAKVPGDKGIVVVTVFEPGTKQVGLPGVRVVLVNAARCPSFARSATTDTRGTARITGAPAGPGYHLYAYPPKGWKIEYSNPSPAEVVGNRSGSAETNLGLEAEHGTAHVPAAPTTCKPR